MNKAYMSVRCFTFEWARLSCLCPDITHGKVPPHFFVAPCGLVVRLRAVVLVGGPKGAASGSHSNEEETGPRSCPTAARRHALVPIFLWLRKWYKKQAVVFASKKGRAVMADQLMEEEVDHITGP